MAEKVFEWPSAELPPFPRVRVVLPESFVPVMVPGANGAWVEEPRHEGFRRNVLLYISRHPASEVTWSSMASSTRSMVNSLPEVSVIADQVLDGKGGAMGRLALDFEFTDEDAGRLRQTILFTALRAGAAVDAVQLVASESANADRQYDLSNAVVSAEVLGWVALSQAGERIEP